MKVRFKLTKTEKLLFLLALVFILGMLMYKNARTSDTWWQITTERESSIERQTIPVNINTATQEELVAVEGIGPKLAQRIIAYREEHGPFQAIEELDNVKGIGPSLIESIRYLVCTEDQQ